MSSPLKEHEQHDESDAAEMIQGLLQPGGTLLGRDMPDASNVNWAQPESHFNPVSFMSAKLLVANAPWMDAAARPGNCNTVVIKHYHEPKAAVQCPYIANKQHNFMDVVTPADVQLAISGMGYVMKETQEAKSAPAIEI